MKPWQRQHWCLPKVDAAFVAAMEDVLELYEEPLDPARPIVCLDEKSKELHQEVRAALPVQKGKAQREDYEYIRNGTANLFVLVEPKAGFRHVAVTQRRTAIDYAKFIKWLVDEAYPNSEIIRVVQDNLNTHKPASLYEVFEPAEARRLLRKLEFHYTPKHASWLNMAEIEISVFERQCLNRRLGDEPTLIKEVAALEAERNESRATINWQFNCEKARTKLHRLYPDLSKLA